MSGRGSKRPLQEAAAAASSSSSSSSGRSRNKSKGFDFKRDIVPMCAKLDGADLSQLRSILQSLVQEGKIAVDMNVVRRWNQARTCEALQKYFIGLEVAPELVNQVHALALGAFPDSMTAPAVIKDLPTMMESGFPDSMTKFLTNQEMIQLSATGQRSKRGTDKSHTQCLASTKQGTQCMKQLQSAEGGCLHFCKTHITQAVKAFWHHAIGQEWYGVIFYGVIIDDISIRILVYANDKIVVQLHGGANSAHTAWCSALVDHFGESIEANGVAMSMDLHHGDHNPGAQRDRHWFIGDAAPLVISKFLTHFGSYITKGGVSGVEEAFIGPGREGIRALSADELDEAQIPFSHLFSSLGLGPISVSYDQE